MRLHTLLLIEHLELNIWCHCVCRRFLVAQQSLNNTSYRFSILISKVEFIWFFNLKFFLFFIFVICHIDLLSFRAFVGLVSKLYTPITLANPTWRRDSPYSLKLWWLLLLVLMQGRWSTDRLTVGQQLWNSAELLRHLLTFQLALNTWKVKPYLYSLDLPCFVASFINNTHREGSCALE